MHSIAVENDFILSAFIEIEQMLKVGGRRRAEFNKNTTATTSTTTSTTSKSMLHTEQINTNKLFTNLALFYCISKSGELQKKSLRKWIF